MYRYSKHFEIFGNGDICVFRTKLRLVLDLSHDDCLILCWVSSQTIFLVPYVYTSEIIVARFFNYCGIFVGIKYLRIICIGRQAEGAKS